MRTAWARAQGRPRPERARPQRGPAGARLNAGPRLASRISREPIDIPAFTLSVILHIDDENPLVVALRGADGIRFLDNRFAWTRRCWIPAFLELARKVAKNRPGIAAILVHGVSNARVETVNTQAGCSPGSPLGSTQPRRSSCSPCSASAAPRPPMPDR
jgi:Transposase